jgi:hypothetical protein
MRYACVGSIKGQMRYVEGPGSCGGDELQLDFATASASAPVYACTNIGPREARFSQRRDPRFRIPPGTTWHARSSGSCDHGRQRLLVLGGRRPVTFCAATLGGNLRYLASRGGCGRGEIEVRISRGRHRGERKKRHGEPPRKKPPGKKPPRKEPPAKEAPNAAPTIAVPGAQKLEEGTHLAFSSSSADAITVADSDSDGEVERVSASVAHGTLTPGPAGTLKSVGGTGSSSLVLEGTIMALNEALEGLTYTPASVFHGADALALEADDLGHTGSGGAQTAHASVALTVEQVDQAPMNAVPGEQTTSENGILTFSAASADAISVQDADSEGGVERVKLGVEHGSLAPGSGGTLVSVSGSGTEALTLEGTVAALNEALEGLTYEPAHNFKGADALTLQTDDLGHTGLGGPKTASSVVRIFVATVVYDEAVDDEYSTPEDTASDEVALEVAAPGMLGDDSDSDSPPLPLKAELVKSTAHGTLALEPDGSFTYAPDPLYVGQDSFTYVDNDGNTTSNEATVTIEVAPQTFDHAEEDSYKTHEGETLVKAPPGVLGNDTDSGGLPLEAALVKEPAHGVLELEPNGSFTYAPDSGYHGEDSFEYRDEDANSSVNEGHSNVATVTIDVEQVDQAPENTVPGAQIVAENGSLSFSPSNATPDAIYVHDIDSEGGVERVSVGVEHGSLTPGSTAALASVSGSGTGALRLEGTIEALNEALDGLTYVPTHNSREADTLTLETDDLGHTGLDGPLTTTSQVSIEVTTVAYDKAADDSYTTDEDETLSVSAPGVLANDTESDGLPLTAVEVTGPAHGTLTLNPDGSFTYVPVDGYAGTDSFTYEDYDGNTDSNIAAVTIEVEPVVFDHAEGDSYSTEEEKKLEVSAPGVLANDTDSKGLTLEAQQVTGPAHGTLELNSDGSFSYEPDPGYSGTDSFEYRDDDGNSAANEGHSNVATVTIEVEHVNHAPTNTVPGQQYVEENSTLTFASAGANAISVADADSDGGVERVSLKDEHGSLTPGTTGELESVSGSGTDALTLEGTISALTKALEGLSYAAAHNYHGADTLELETDDLGNTGDGGAKTTTSEVPIEVTAVAYDHAVDDSYEVNEDQELNVATPTGVLANDTDSDGLPLTAVEVTGPAHGTLTLNSDGSFTYVPADGYTGEDSFTYEDNDGNTDSNVATVTIHIEPEVFDTAYNDSYSTIENQKLEVDASEGVLANDTDSAGLTLEAERVTGPAHGTLKLNPDGSFSYEPDGGFLGTDTFTYRDNDGNSAANEGHSNVATVTIEVESPHVNEPPTLSLPGEQEVAEHTASNLSSLTFSSANNDSITVGDPDADGGIEFVKLKAEHGVLDLGSTSSLHSNTGDGTGAVELEGTIPELNEALEGLVYEPAEGYGGSAELSVEISDLGHSGSGGAKTDSGDVAIEVVPTPSPTNPTYSGAIGNTELSVGVTRGATADVEESGSVLPSPAEESDGSKLTVVKEKITTEQGGTVEMNENGTFTYVPPVSFENGSDHFSYEEKDSAGGEAMGTVTIKVDDARVWYVNDSVGTNGNGESSSPFDTLSSASGSGSKTGSGDYIYAYGGGATYAGGIELKEGQKLVGEDEELSVEGERLLGASGGNPTITNSSGAGIKLAEGDKIDGVTVSGTSGAGIAASKVNGFTLDSKVKIESTTGDGLEVSEGSGTIADEATIKTSSAHSLAISNRSGGTASVSGAIEDSGTGISLSSDSGATIAFSGKLTLSTGTHEAFHATGGGTVTATDAESTAATTTATALDVENTTIGVAGLKFRSISAGTSSTGPSHGIALVKTGSSNGLDVTGSVGADSGGTVQHTTGSDGGIYLVETDDDSLTDMDVAHSSSSGIYGKQVYALSVAGSSLTNNGEDGLFIEANSGPEVSIKATAGDSFAENKEQGFEAADNGVGTLNVTAEKGSFTGNTSTGVDITSESGGTVDFDVAGNKLTDQQGNAINLFVDGSGKAEGEVVENEVGVAKVANSGSAAGDGIEIDAGKSETLTTNVSKNKVFEIENEHGIEAHAGEGSATLNITLEKNEVHTEETSSLDGIFVDSGVLSSDTSTVCMNATENISNSAGTEAGNLTRETYGFVLIQQTPSAVFEIQGFNASEGTSNAAVDNFLASKNTLSAGGGPAEVEFYKGFTSAEKCPTVAP